MSGVTLNQVIKKFGETQVIHGVDLDIKDGELCVFVGPSGCGKSTLLRMIAGLEQTSAGTITIGDRDVTTADPADRGVAMVFQSYALYPHMTVAENMGFGLKMNGVPKDVVREKVLEAAKILKLEDYLDRRPKALSGGQRQRVAIGRAIVRGPEVFLFDEPLSNLDAALRVQTRIEIARLHERLGTTMIYVTHDQVEAMTLADKIVVLRGGNIEQIGAPIDLYENPRNMFVAEFIGSPSMNFFSASDLSEAGQTLLKPGSDVFGVRPEHFSVVDQADAILSARPDFVENLGEYALIYCKTDAGSEFIVKSTELQKFAKGELVHLGADAEKTYCFDGTTQLRV